LKRLAARFGAVLPERWRRLSKRRARPGAATAGVSGFEARFARYVEWLTAEGYAFAAFGSDRPDLMPSVVYLRYDTGPDGLPAARRLAEQHQRLRVPGSFALAWDLIAANPRLAAQFLALRTFNPQFVQFGLSCAPVENFLRHRRFAGDTRRQGDFLASPAFPAFLDRLTVEQAAVIRAGAVDQLRTETAAFATAFGAWPTVAGRSGAWAAAFARERARRPELAWLDDVFHPVRFLAALDLGDYGFGPEAAALPGDDKMGPHIMFGGGDPEKVRRDHHQRVWSGRGFVAIFPPGTWIGNGFDRLTVPPPIPEPPPATTPAATAPAATTPPATAPAATTSPSTTSAARPVLTNLEDLVPFGRRCERLDSEALAAAARRRVGPRLEPLFRHFVAWLKGEGYVFDDLDHGPPDFGARRVYLRYDVHIQDLLPAYLLADWHRRLAIPGSFQLNWRFSAAEREIEPFFLKFREFDPRFVQIGLHCAPPATWFLEECCGGELRRAEETVAAPAFAEYLRDLLAAYRRAGDDAEALLRLRAGTETRMASLADSFRAAFGVRQTVSGHGNFLAAAFARLQAQEPATAPLYDYFNAVGWLQRCGVTRFGFARELTVFPDGPRDPPCVILEGGDQTRRRRDLHHCVEQGLGFLCLLHPATLTTDDLAALLPAGLR
jgi:hypothetical protein